MSQIRKVLALTGIRSEYDLLFPLLKRLNAAEDFELGIVVSGAHLTPLHHYSVHQIEQDGFHIVAKIESFIWSDSVSAKVKSIGLIIQGLASVLAEEKPDLMIVLGDREEVLAGSMAATYMGVPIVHIAGGDQTDPSEGDVDEEVRHAASKLSHVHLTMHPAHSERLMNLGEEAWRVHTVGNGGIDRLASENGISLEQLAELLGPDVKGQYVIFIYHPLSSAIDMASKEVEIALEALSELNVPVFIGAPNSDPGFTKVLDVLDKFASKPGFHLYRNLPRAAFLTLLKNASCIVGNSSLGILEAPYLGLPAVNVGERQRGRISGRNVQFVNASFNEIKAAVQKALFDKGFSEQAIEDRYVYGDGQMADKSIEILRSLPEKTRLLAKKHIFHA
ncbi:UDP-N-acetylglucosamine 2-epimerase/UDP-hydrolysing UDP-N-acetyl-D-glucosamine 2-epimerase,TIGR03568 [Paenibacillus taihuensis]|uniref:UDP-N-acetylglucosamine 2-epimerase/UDP-hydrolysing UDP-N-acetyl-D-glucosamine 2-epimerase,TIGR03568 n=1 Tax=Paenibacillus taihuensis TaxID=1156355 RepID=A0A3D9RYJ1_9BACL|nr:UDP-N-acetylglucosamine 2-epimerase [Paenibacillus taihuensis]REE84508.1 UDP-N-acetylglucosamine 2-epimerase/UDP-hydrolysing UDP-N-acetyl-D-glucosamine 2-epimerase,TIGR03568 [Paenibacillus taihuensis]